MSDRGNRIARIAAGLAEMQKRVAFRNELTPLQELRLVRTVKIIVEGFPPSRTASGRKKLQRAVSGERPGRPHYPLDKIKEIARTKPTRVVYSRLRSDGQSNPTLTLGISEAEATAIIASLTPGDFYKKYLNQSPIADAYCIRRKINGVSRQLYIKLRLDNDVLVFVISFHESYCL